MKLKQLERMANDIEEINENVSSIAEDIDRIERSIVNIAVGMP